MADFNIRSESVDVEQIMGHIRARIREKRGVDYTEDQIRELATVRLEKFLDPKNLRSDLLDQFRRSRPAIPAEPSPIDPPYGFDDQTLFASHRGGLRVIRKLLQPVLKLFFNPNTLNQILHAQAQFNADILKREQRRKIEFEQSRSEWNTLYYEVLHNLVLETTRNGIELKNMKMRLEALASRLDFSERRVRALEGVVQYRPEAVRPRPSAIREPRDRDRDRTRERPAHQEAEAIALQGDSAVTPVTETGEMPAGSGGPPPSDPGSRRRRRRRRGRRGAGPAPFAAPGAEDPSATVDTGVASGEDSFDEGNETEVGSASFDDAQGGPFDDAQDKEARSSAGAAPGAPPGHPSAGAAPGAPPAEPHDRPAAPAESREHEREAPTDPEQQ